MSANGLRAALGETATAVDATLARLLPAPEGLEGRVADAMRYATLAGGKRLRPFLLVASARLFGVEDEPALRAASAVEMIHSYSLVHDDLPAMDDDDPATWRGRRVRSGTAPECGGSRTRTDRTCCPPSTPTGR